ncbi:MAG: choice-of-anchor J domain-containing protein [Muribaculaceae bacterium]|nr:choice-of-anchor J domain-containing protein [Muribaculaceae bacterium]
MKSIIKNLSLALGALGTLSGFTACQDDINTPEIVKEAPVATLKPNSTILEVKQIYWEETTPYCTQIGTKDNGDHYIVKGRVISSDYSGNIFKSLYIQDETAALPLSINQYNLYLGYRVGQEVVIDLTGLYIGRYSGLEQLGYPQWSASYNAYQPTFMQPGILDGHIELNGWPEPEKVDTILISSLAELSTNATSAAYLQKMQGQLVRINNVKFVPQNGLDVLGIYHENVNQAIEDNDGNQLTIRTSGYSNFWNTKLPEEKGDIVGILGYYYSSSDPSSSWQLTLIDKEGMMNFGNPTLPLGSIERPYTVEEAVKAETAGTAPTGWTEGYIVGTIAPEVENITSASQIEWGANATLPSSVVIGLTPDSRSLDECLVMALPQNSVMRAYVALANHPENLGKKLTVYGRLEKYMGTYGIIDNNGTADEFMLEGVEIIVGGTGTEEDPYDVNKVIGFNPQSTTDTEYPGVWVKGYIVGTYHDYDAHFETANASNNNILLADSPNVTDKSKCIDVQLPFGDVRTAINLANNPGMLGAEVMLYGDVLKYNTMPGLKNTTKYKILSQGSGGGDDPTPPGNAGLDETFDASTSLPSGWSAIKVEGNKAWYVATYSGNNYASMTGYKGTAPFDSWLVSPAVDLSQVTAKTLSFTSQVNGYGSTTSQIEVYVLSSADPATATKTKLNAAWPSAPSSGYSSWLSSGSLDLSQFSGTVYIGFRYTATEDSNYATWCIDNVAIPAK